MKRRIFILILLIGILCGCTNIKNMSYEDCINTIVNSNKKTNSHHKGYSLYIPYGMSIKEAYNTYSIINNDDYEYYLYLDFISYINKKEMNYVINKDAVYSTIIKYNDKVGYAEINLVENNKYLIEIMYNYAKIEVMVESDYINEAIINSVTILNSIEYNDIAINEMINDDNLDYTEEKFDIFENTKVNSNRLEFIEEENDSEENEVKDTDYID